MDCKRFSSIIAYFMPLKRVILYSTRLIKHEHSEKCLISCQVGTSRKIMNVSGRFKQRCTENYIYMHSYIADVCNNKAHL